MLREGSAPRSQVSARIRVAALTVTLCCGCFHEPKIDITRLVCQGEEDCPKGYVCNVSTTKCEAPGTSAMDAASSDARIADPPMVDAGVPRDGRSGLDTGTGGAMGGSGGRADANGSEALGPDVPLTGTGGFLGLGGMAGTGGTTRADAAEDAAGGQGGSTARLGTGGVLTGTGAAVGTGGISGVGGQNESGGRPGTGGSSSRGGSPGTGGTLGTGGSGTGGSPGTGGKLGTGGSGTGGSGTGGSGTGGSGTGGSGTGGTTYPPGQYPPGNPAVPSNGCGQALSTIQSGTHTYTMTSAGLSREYVITVPGDYDPNQPHRLVFGMHWMGGSDNAVRSDGYYQLQPLDTASTTIFVAPQGYTDASPWRLADDKDHTFFEDMVTLFKSELCIDTSRIFAVGFSFGAMFTNSLAQNHQKLLRGVVVYATAIRNIYLPSNTGEPLAWWGMVGLADGTCPPDDGRAARDRFVENNGCTVPASVPEAQSGGSHVCYDYQCDGKHPVTWCTFDGGHMDYPVDPGQSTTWVPAATWSFITQF